MSDNPPELWDDEQFEHVRRVVMKAPLLYADEWQILKRLEAAEKELDRLRQQLELMGS